MTMRDRNKRSYIRVLLLPAVVLTVVLCFWNGVSDLSQGRADEERLQLETAVRRAVVACYAAEGFYPPNLEYLQEQYGVQIDQEKYAVIYDAFGSNLMPDITVLERMQ